MAIPRVFILRAPAANCDRETAVRLRAGRRSAERIHINRLREQPALLQRYQILVIPGGFTYGDDVAAGKILANQLEPLPRRRPAAIPRCREADPRHLQRLPGVAQGRPALSARRGRAARHAGPQRLRPIRGPLGLPPGQPRQVSVPQGLRQPASAGGPRRRQLHLPGAVDIEGTGTDRPGRAAICRCGKAGRGHFRSTPTVRKATWPGCATRPAGCWA